MAIKFTNFARGLLSVGIGTGDTTITLSTGYGALFPTLGVGDYFYATLENSTLSREIVKVTARATDTLTVVRAQDNTTAQSWNAGDSLSLRFNAAAITDSVANKVAYTTTTGSAVIPSGTTAQRDASPVASYLRYNTDTGAFEGYSATGWGSIGGGAKANETLLETKHNVTADYTLTTGASAVTVGPLSVATGKAVTIPSGEAVVALSIAPTPAANDVTPITTGAQTIYGQKTFTAQPNIAALTSMVRLNTANGYGSTNNKIVRYSTVVTNQGSDITYADSATLGASFTINTSGVYAISSTVQLSAGAWSGLSLNTSAPTTAVTSLTASEVLTASYMTTATGSVQNSWVGYLPAGSIVRSHADGTALSAGAPQTQFTITRVA